MPAKIADHIKRKNIILPAELSDEIDQWRGRQPGVPNASEAMRRLMQTGLKADAGGKSKRK